MLSAGAALARCDDLLPSAADAAGASRLVNARDLIELREIGQPDNSVLGPSPLALSPDGQSVAFVLTRGDIATNSVCRGIVVVELATGRARLVDTGGEDILDVSPLRGLADTSGFPALIRPAWSPDGRFIAYLRRDQGVTQAWRARADGAGARPITHFAVDADAVGWSHDGRRLVVASRPGWEAMRADIDREGARGWLYDARVVPDISARPQLSASVPEQFDAIALRDGAQGRASADDIQDLTAARASDDASDPVALAADGARARTAPTTTAFRAPRGLQVTDATGRPVQCDADACRGRIVGIWWRGASTSLWFLKREGLRDGEMGLYHWDFAAGAPRRLLSTSDVLTGCVMAPSGLVCIAENATVPRRIVRIDLASGRMALVYDPSPEFAHIRLGHVERLTWRNAYGLPAWGDLLLPPDARPGEKLPLIVVQYHSQGFLRGGTGGEYPNFLFAAHGFAVLGLDRPPFFAETLPNLTTSDQFNAVDEKRWAERWSLLSSLRTGVEKVIGMGLVDPRRMGITGLSDGSTTVRFSLVNYPVFAAAAISTCCAEPRTVMVNGGIAWADWLHDAIGYPRSIDDIETYWRPASVALNARRIDTPLLMQLADSEFQLSLETFTALREAGKPVEMYVYPDEYHLKVQPVHRLNVALRSLDWFDFWLNGHEDPDPAKADQYRRWEAMRVRVPPPVNPMSVPSFPRLPGP